MNIFFEDSPLEVTDSLITFETNIFTVVNDETRYGNNVAVMDSQTKEEREAKAQRNYHGNGKVVWTNDIIKLAEREEVNASAPVSNDLPF